MENNYSIKLKRLVEPLKEKGYRYEFLKILRNWSGVGNVGVDDTDVVLFAIQEAYNGSKIKDAFVLADRHRNYGWLESEISRLNDKDFGVLLGTLLYTLVQKDRVPIRLNERKRVLKAIYLLQGVRI